MIVRELLTRLGFKVDQASIDRADRATERVKDGAEKAADAFGKIAAAIGGFAILQGVAHVADQMQNLEARLASLPQTVGDVGESFNTIVDHADRARTSVDAYGTMYTRLAGAVKEYVTSQEDVLQITDAITQSLRINGTSSTEAASATLQLSQAFQKGKLNGDEFQSFMENTSTDLKDKLAKELGTTAGALYDLSSSGKLTARDLAFAFKRMAPEIEKEMLRLPMTVGDATTIVGNHWSRMIRRLDRESGAISKIAKWITDGLDWIEGGINRLIKKLGGADDAVRLLGFTVAATATLIATTLLPVLIELLPFVAAVAALALVFEDLYVWINGGKSLIGDMIGSWEEWRDTVMTAFRMVKDVFVSLWGVVRPFFQAFKALWDGDPKAYAKAVEEFYSALSKLWERLRPILWAALKALVVLVLIMLKHLAIAIGTALQAAWNSYLEKMKDRFIAWCKEIALKAASLLPFGDLIVSGVQAVEAYNNPEKLTPQQTGQPGKGAPQAVHGPTTVYVTVPNGTPKEQQDSFKKAAEKAFGVENKQKQARAMSAHGN